MFDSHVGVTYAGWAILPRSVTKLTNEEKEVHRMFTMFPLRITALSDT